MARLENQLTWSASRAGTLDWCERKYWWTYYGSWGGWERGAPGAVREAYMLKNLSNRWAWVGTVVHDTIERILKRFAGARPAGSLAFDPPVVDVEKEIEGVTKRMRADWRTSKSGLYRERPKKAFGLSEHEYEDPVPRAEWQELNKRARRGVRQFLESELFAEIRESDPARWLPIEQLDRFDFEGVPVWCVLDFGMKTDDGGVEIYDWKTGAYKPDSYKTQLGAYAMYMKHLLGLGPEDVSTRLVFLGDEFQVHELPVTEADLREVRGEMRASIARMRNRLRDVAANDAVREDFPLTDDLDKCATCVFRRPCGRIGAGRQVP